MHFDISAIQQFLTRRYPDVHNLQPLANGWWSQALSFSTVQQDLVLRINQHPTDFQKDVFAFKHFSSPALTIPEVVATGSYDDSHYFCISNFIAGTPSDRILMPKDIDGNRQLALTLLQPLHTIHAMDTTSLQGWGYTDASGKGIYGSWSAFLLSIHNSKMAVSWQELVQQGWLNGDLFTRLLDKMKTWFPYLPATKHVVHGDYGYDNVLLTPDHQIAAVIDWAEMLLGDPIYDLIHMNEPWNQPEGMNFVELWKQDVASRGGELVNFEERLRCYNIHYTLFHLHIHAARQEREECQQIEQWAIQNL
jgi:hygromycin-B 4-O-kinase